MRAPPLEMIKLCLASTRDARNESIPNLFLAFPYLQANKCTLYNLMSLSLAITNSPLLEQQKSMTSLSRTYDSLNKQRKRARIERVCLLKGGLTHSFKNSPHGKNSLFQDQEILESRSCLSVHPMSAGDTRKGNTPFFFQARKTAQKRVCKDFTNILMRHGARLQYQNILRKGLLAL